LAWLVYETDQDGIVRLVAQEGDTLAVGAPIAHVGEAADVGVAGTAETQPDGQAQSAAAPVGVAAAPSPPTAPPETEGATVNDGERVKASPLARRIAREQGVDLHALTGTGPGGRIVKADVQAGAAADTTSTGAGDAPAPESGGVPAVPATLAERVATAKGETTVVELTRTQQTIARRMAESKATIPDFALQAEVDMERCVALRAELKRLSPEEAPTYNDMVVKACALALHEAPRANGSYRDGRLQLHSRVNVGVAVAADSDDPLGGALVVPTIFDAALKSLGEIARETRALAERVRAGTITPPELGGGTFTVSNLGMYGVRSFTAIVNPPQAAILSVGSLEPRAVVLAGDADGGGEVVARHTMSVTLVCDHRILYGADAARFLARVRELLEEPAALAL
jgi:pyruvate dehydrogenase E2 component (dihydrolipoamide acetyltransferase)